MAGAIKRAIEQIVAKRSRGNEAVGYLTKTKIILKGVQIEKYSESSPDDPIVLERLKEIASELGVEL